MPTITAYLFHAGGHDDPARCMQINGKELSWAAYVLGMGFTFDDTDTEGYASPLARDAST